jgi:hypothetical protein
LYQLFEGDNGLYCLCARDAGGVVTADVRLCTNG